MAVAVSWSLKKISLLVGSCIFILIYISTKFTSNAIPIPLSGASDENAPEWRPDQPMNHALDFNLPKEYVPPPPPPKKPKPPPIPWAEAKFKADAEEAAKRRKAEHERKIAESPENKRKAEELFKKIAAEQQKALAEQARIEKENDGKLPFQSDLAYDPPSFDTRELRRYKPHNWDGPGHSTIATYLATPGGSLKEPYFVAALQLAYRLLWDPRSKSKHTFTVFVAPHITEQQRSILTAAGALVKQLDPVESPAASQFPRWKFQFAKLHMWKQFDFSRILFLDSDAFPFAPIDEILDLPQLGCKRDLLPPEDAPLADILCQYSFNVAPQGFQPKDETAELNVGVMLLQPNDSMHKRLLRGLQKGDVKWETRMADQGYLSEMFKTSGPFPFESLERKWNGFFPQPNERGLLKIVHEKLWMPPTDPEDSLAWAKNDFASTHQEMLKFFNDKDFVERRKKDGLKPFE